MLKTNIKVKLNDKAIKNVISNGILNKTFNIKCPKCHFAFTVTGSSFGKNVICPHCNVTINLNDKSLRQSINNLKL